MAILDVSSITQSLIIINIIIISEWNSITGHILLWVYSLDSEERRQRSYCSHTTARLP